MSFDEMFEVMNKVNKQESKDVKEDSDPSEEIDGFIKGFAELKSSQIRLKKASKAFLRSIPEDSDDMAWILQVYPRFYEKLKYLSNSEIVGILNHLASNETRSPLGKVIKRGESPPEETKEKVSEKPEQDNTSSDSEDDEKKKDKKPKPFASGGGGGGPTY